MKSPKSNIPKKDWCTFDITKSCKTKSKLYKTFTQNPNDINKQNYITFRNKLNPTLKKAKQTYYYNIFKECDIKTWSCINSIKKCKSIKSFPSQIFTNGNHINNNKDICKCFNSYFTNIGANLSKNTNNSKDPLSYINSLNNPSFYVTPTNQIEILKTINNKK